MIKKHSTILALTGLALVAAGQVQAGTSFVGEDLLLDFRNSTITSGTLSSDADITVDVGNVSSFVTTAADNGGVAILDTDSALGYVASSFLQAPAFSGASLLSTLGTPSTGNTLGFSAAASDKTVTSSGTGLIWLTRVFTGTPATPPTPASAAPTQQPSQGTTSIAVYDIGLGSESGTTLANSSANAVTVANAGINSYQTRGQANSSTQQVINYGGGESTLASRDGTMEATQTGAGNVYEALWEVPEGSTGTSAGDTYEGYFTFAPDGEVTFTTAAAVPEVPATGLIAGIGMLVAAARRQFASRKA